METSKDKEQIVHALLRFSKRELKVMPGTQAFTAGMQVNWEVEQFTPIREANELLLSNAFAYLVALVFNRGVVAQKAWEAPWFLKQRLGHLDPTRIIAESDLVEAAVATAPALHRYVETMPNLIVQAARRVLDEYEGEASRIWSGDLTARGLEARLQAFSGIGQKISAMAVAQAAFELGIPLTGLDQLDVAVDRHVIRVFVRTGLADRPDHARVLQAARELCPTEPHALDLPAWRVGERWCHAGVPNCGACVLRLVCPKLLDRPTADDPPARMLNQPPISASTSSIKSKEEGIMTTTGIVQRRQNTNQRQPEDFGQELLDGKKLRAAIHKQDGRYEVYVSLVGAKLLYEVHGPSGLEGTFEERQCSYLYTGLSNWTKENLGGSWRWELADLSKTRFR